jgi:hypothetical protein
MSCGVVRAGHRPEKGNPARSRARAALPANRKWIGLSLRTRVGPGGSHALKGSPPQGKGTEALMTASVALRSAGTLGRGVAKPQVKHVIGVSDPHTVSIGFPQGETCVFDGGHIVQACLAGCHALHAREVTGSALATCGAAEERAHGCRRRLMTGPLRSDSPSSCSALRPRCSSRSTKLRQRREGVAKVGTCPVPRRLEWLTGYRGPWPRFRRDGLAASSPQTRPARRPVRRPVKTCPATTPSIATIPPSLDPQLAADGDVYVERNRRIERLPPSGRASPPEGRCCS